MIALLLGWTKLPQWATELLFTGVIVVTVASGIMYWHHETLKKGIAEQIAADNKASQSVIAQAKAETAALQVKADTAETAHAKEIADLTAQLSASPAEPVRLCNAHRSASGLPQTSSQNNEHASSGTAAAAVQPVSEGNHRSGNGGSAPNIGPLLELLAFQADAVSAELREYQAR